MRPEDRNAHPLWRAVLGRRVETKPFTIEKTCAASVRDAPDAWPADYKNTKEHAYSDAELGSQSNARSLTHHSIRKYISLAVLSALGLSLYYLFARAPHFGPCGSSAHLEPTFAEDVCPQSGAVAPVKNGALLNALEAEFQTDAFKLKAYESLGGAVRVPYVLL